MFVSEEFKIGKSRSDVVMHSTIYRNQGYGVRPGIGGQMDWERNAEESRNCPN